MKSIVLGMVAHVDAGKTTLSEAMLYQSQAVRTMGRVDHGTTFLDFDSQEKNRGITIFSKEAHFTWNDTEVTLLDTPGHVDFSAEMERTLQVLDVALLLINAVDGIQSHTETIWKLLRHYQVPVFIFVNKMDIAHRSQSECKKELTEYFGPGCISFQQEESLLLEEIAMCDDELLDQYMTKGTLTNSQIAGAFARRQVIPCYFGSALKQEGVQAILQGLSQFTEEKQYPKEFGARVYKISHDATGNRLTHVRVSGGSLKAKQSLCEGEKIDQIRMIHGSGYTMVPELFAGQVGALKGITHVQAGEVFGIEKIKKEEQLSSAMTYRMCLPKQMDAFAVMKRLKPLMEEEPSLHLQYDTSTQEIQLQARGMVQIEILQTMIKQRFDLDVTFDEGRISYRESLRYPVEGVGHYEPLRHYAEVHVLLEPLARGSGMQYQSICPINQIDGATQRMMLSYLQEETWLGVLTGSFLTDIRISILGGKAHEKHTSGGDFREALRRAVRQGLKMGESFLLEPQDHFRLEFPMTNMSKAMYDLEQMGADYEAPLETSGVCQIIGTAPARYLYTYEQEVRSYTKGKGRFFHTMEGYTEVKDPDRVIHDIGYDSERDVEHPTGSIFCEHGAGVHVRWDEVQNHMHVPMLYEIKEQAVMPARVHRQIQIDDETLKRVTAQLHQPRKQWKQTEQRQEEASTSKQTKAKPFVKKETCMLIDGYNMIFTWPNLRELAEDAIDSARNRLLSLLGSYQGYRKCTCIVVFDAYRTDRPKEQIYQDHHVYVIYTKAQQTADTYIEKATHTLADQYHVIVATSDAQEQNIILGQGATRMSAMELYQEITHTQKKETMNQVNQPQFRHMALEELRKYNDEDQE